MSVPAIEMPGARKFRDAHQKIPILIIDDDPIAVRIMSRVLEAAGHQEVVGSTDSRRALQLYLKMRPGIVLLDINMPHLDGWEFLRRLTEFRAAGGETTDEGDLPPQIAIVSADLDAAKRSRAVSLGARDMIAKPIDPVDFAIRVRNLAQMADALHRAARESAAPKSADGQPATADALRNAEMALKARTEQLATVAHELRTPLNAVLGFAELIKDEAHGPIGERLYADHAKEIHFAALHMLGLVNNILDTAKTDAGKMTVHITEVDVGSVIRASLAILRDLAARSSVELDCDIPDPFPLLRTDAQKLQQILLNLVSNAIKFTPPGGSVRVKARYSPSEGVFILVVSDSGVGMTAEESAAAMESFGQTGREVNRSHKGTGLGLPLTRKLVERLGGDLALESKPGIGTTVTVRFPADAVAFPVPPPPDEGGPPKPPPKPD